ncbi:peptide ABC transporter substrate-binding protein [Dendrosporobacter sp. 1207_IL3150]|uniref:peptide ABC transporter substrate-binding protein n=1 Tax=Dendrosporobacter sp. 1207_IL3150 TaxID=3084054 RepID=UPI002FD983D3
MNYRVILSILLTLMVLLSGCGGVNVETKNSSKANIQVGGQLSYGSLQEPNTLNPLLSDMLATSEIGRLIFNGLVITNDKGEWMPDLAQHVPTIQNGGVSSDGLNVIYKLRQGVTWHDGAPFTAEDVVFTWQTIINSKNNVVLRDGYDKIASIETPDPYTVHIKFKQYYAPYLTLFPTILPKHLLESADINKSQFNRAPVGTGAFKFKEWRIADAIVFEANSSYFMGKPNLNTIIYKIFPDTNIMLTQIKAGQIDIASNVNASQFDQVKAVAGYDTVISPNMIWEHLDFNLDNSLFQDVRVRTAISLSIDRQAIVNDVLKNVASPALSDQSPLSWAYNPALSPVGRDINSARDLLTQAGWKQGPDGVFAKDGKKLAFAIATTSGNKVREYAAQAIVGQLREVGIEAEVRFIEAPLFFSDILKNRRFETAMYAWVAGVDPENKTLWHSKSIPSRSNGYEGQNYPGWRNAEIDNLTEQGSLVVDVDARKLVYFRIQDILRQENPIIPLYYRANIDAVKNNVANYKPNPTPAGNLWNAWELGLISK